MGWTAADGVYIDPIELRRTLNIDERESLEIYVDGNSVILRKYQPSCVFCDDATDVRWRWAMTRPPIR